MRTKTIRENYTGVCRYCGVIFKSNRSDALHCGDNHRALYGQYGARIDPLVINDKGERYNADLRLQAAYDNDKEAGRLTPDGWSHGLARYMLENDFHYCGPFPQEGELLVVGSFLMERHPWWEDGEIRHQYFVKPFSLLTAKERATGVFVSAAERRAKEVDEELSQAPQQKEPFFDLGQNADWPTSITLPKRKKDDDVSEVF